MAYKHSAKIYDQLVDTIERLDTMEAMLKKENAERKAAEQTSKLLEKRMETLEKKDAEKDAIIERLEAKNIQLEETVKAKDNQIDLLNNEVERLKSINNNDSNNSSTPPSQNQIGAKRKARMSTTADQRPIVRSVGSRGTKAGP